MAAHIAAGIPACAPGLAEACTRSKHDCRQRLFTINQATSPKLPVGHIDHVNESACNMLGLRQSKHEQGLFSFRLEYSCPARRLSCLNYLCEYSCPARRLSCLNDLCEYSCPARRLSCLNDLCEYSCPARRLSCLNDLCEYSCPARRLSCLNDLREYSCPARRLSCLNDLCEYSCPARRLSCLNDLCEYSCPAKRVSCLNDLCEYSCPARRVSCLNDLCGYSCPARRLFCLNDLFFFPPAERLVADLSYVPGKAMLSRDQGKNCRTSRRRSLICPRKGRAVTRPGTEVPITRLVGLQRKYRPTDLGQISEPVAAAVITHKVMELSSGCSGRYWSDAPARSATTTPPYLSECTSRCYRRGSEAPNQSPDWRVVVSRVTFPAPLMYQDCGQPWSKLGLTSVVAASYISLPKDIICRLSLQNVWLALDQLETRNASIHCACVRVTQHSSARGRARRGCVVVRPLAPHLGELGLIAGGVVTRIFACGNRVGRCPPPPKLAFRRCSILASTPLHSPRLLTFLSKTMRTRQIKFPIPLGAMLINLHYRLFMVDFMRAHFIVNCLFTNVTGSFVGTNADLDDVCKGLQCRLRYRYRFYRYTNSRPKVGSLKCPGEEHGV
ncbi:hypothetical protein PR048_030038 [Dryococelus australis]|uniref:Uncharacterized protein n=1 Tax=Dryococelus australis TaxID=614101 RepID=A0ABQ9G7U1_9NEOP|nr:hypothetical protein PR048_030038 [Dryococelus australis]